MIDGCWNSSAEICREVIDEVSPGVTTSHCECVLTDFGKRLLIIQRIVLIFLILYGIFYLWMLVDCAMRKNKGFNKLVWLLLILFIPFASIFYYFKIKRVFDKKRDYS